jgi:hypothetical protein
MSNNKDQPDISVEVGPKPVLTKRWLGRGGSQLLTLVMILCGPFQSTMGVSTFKDSLELVDKALCKKPKATLSRLGDIFPNRTKAALTSVPTPPSVAIKLPNINHNRIQHGLP